MANLDPAWFGYGALFAILATSFAPGLWHARIAIAIAALIALPLTIFHASGPGYALLAGLILLVNIGQAARGWIDDVQIRFSPEEQEIRRLHFGGLGAGDARRLIDQGHWISAKRGEVLIREDQAAPSLFYLADGTATIRREGVDVGALAAGALIGEATVLDGSHATGTVVLSGNARLWFVPAAALRAYLAANPGIAGALHEGFARALRGKLASANARIADMPPIA
ncbi:MAG TPA: cyclic nucleotide-binding domain-containing protein [Sphingopyxis sp.]|nr:cyclic nucleotide-binding domain-containing protein [Sphingopyxis sp.]HMP46126.1 cyclic nucleotide-binding domain-containing protein [Sphingopyxis sp.]HMQ19757.1 cyclic nucleotide-binding domain-containing protein [Sphingopyxis sp.]